MNLKKPPQMTPIPISSFILHKGRYKVDTTYQREAGTWSRLDEQYLIDTIHRGFAVPPIFLHEKGDKEFIVDGQQRLNTIWKFREDKLPLSQKHSEDIINDEKNIKNNSGKPAYTYSKLHKDWQNIFDSYPLPIIYLTDYNDEEIRDLFRRLQHGKPLIPGEILNAYPGQIIQAMRKLAKNKFFRDIMAIRARRYKHYYIAAQLMYLEDEGISDISPKYIYDFFETNKNLTKSSKIYSSSNKTLNYLSEVFRSKTPELQKPGWIITLYLFVSHLLENYSMNNQKRNLKNFFIEFYQAIVDSSESRDEELIKFNLAISKGTTSQKNIELRYDIILKRFLNKYKPKKLDENRLFTNEQKFSIFRRDKEKCKKCKRKLTFNSANTHYHHKDRYIEGGETDIENGLLVCKKCHLNKIHGRK